MIQFPDPRNANSDGLVCIGGELTVPNLIHAYQKGIFPWPHEGFPMLWFSPDPRGVLFFEKRHVPRSLSKFLKKKNWRWTMNKAFDQVIGHCRQQPRPGQKGTWIIPEMELAYQRLEKAGAVLSFEIWDEERLIGGLYGVKSKNYFSAESMFYLEDNASKMAFLVMTEELQRLGHQWVDLQMVTPVCEAFGAEYISRAQFLEMI